MVLEQLEKKISFLPHMHVEMNLKWFIYINVRAKTSRRKQNTLPWFGFLNLTFLKYNTKSMKSVNWISLRQKLLLCKRHCSHNEKADHLEKIFVKHI